MATRAAAKTVGFAAELPAAKMTECGRLLRAAADRVTEALEGARLGSAGPLPAPAT